MKNLMLSFLCVALPFSAKADLSSVRVYTGSSVNSHLLKLKQLPVRADMDCARWTYPDDGKSQVLTPDAAFQEFARMVANRGLLGIDSVTKHHYFQDSGGSLARARKQGSSIIMGTGNLSISENEREIREFSVALLKKGGPTVYVSCETN